MNVAFAVTASARDTYAFIGGIKANSLVLVTLCGGNHFRFIEESYKKNAEVLVYPQKNLTFAPLKEKLRYANEK